MNQLKLCTGLLAVSTISAQYDPSASVTMNYAPLEEVGFRSQARFDLGDYVFTHLFNKEVGQPLSAGYGKVFSARHKGFVEAGFTAFKLSDSIVYGAEIGKSYQWSRFKGYTAGVFPVQGNAFLLTDNELTLPFNIKIRSFANAPLPMFRAIENELKKKIGCKGGLCYALSAQDDYNVKKHTNVVKFGVIIQR